MSPHQVLNGDGTVEQIGCAEFDTYVANASWAALAQRYAIALNQIIRGEEEAPVGMSNPAAVARAALSRDREPA